MNRRVLTAIFVVALCAVYGLLSYERHSAAQAVPECNPAELAAARRSGDAAAAAVAVTRPGSMERQYAIMAIRARETEIRSAGFPSAADAFAAAAEQRLTSDGVLTDRL